MVTAYYLMELSKTRKYLDNSGVDVFERYYSNLPKKTAKLNRCRVCLKEGTISIFNEENSPEILETLNYLTDVNIIEDDSYSKNLCKVCYKFIRTAILFRRVAKQSDETLKKPIKEEKYHEYQATSPPDFEDSNSETKEWSNDATAESETEKKNEKKEKVKLSPKVTCEVCSKVINRSYYKEHLTMHDPDHQKYVCDVCGKSFRLRCAYQNHSRRHRTDFVFKCHFCPYRGRYAELLKNHLRTHSGDYRYMCTECPARFLFKSNLNSHMLKHKEPQLKCDACKRAFHTKLALQRHFEADHLGIKTHVCNVCGKAFGYRNAMMKHQRRVHKRQKFHSGRIPSYLKAEQGNMDLEVSVNVSHMSA